MIWQSFSTKADGFKKKEKKSVYKDITCTISVLYRVDSLGFKKKSQVRISLLKLIIPSMRLFVPL